MTTLVSFCRTRSVVSDLSECKLTVCEMLEKNVRRTLPEADLALKLSALLSVQLGLDIEEEVSGALSSIAALLADPAQSEGIRVKAAEALGIATYFSCSAPVKRGQCLATLRQVWSGIKVNASTPQLFCAALLAWVQVLERVSLHFWVNFGRKWQWMEKLCSSGIVKLKKITKQFFFDVNVFRVIFPPFFLLFTHFTITLLVLYSLF